MASVPQTMSGILIEEPGDAEVLKWKTDLAVPQLSEGKILVKNEWVGVNYIDTYFRKGLYKAPMPMITGGEAGGIVVDVHPSVSNFKPGDRLPDNISTQTAAASLLQGLTALTFIREAYPVKAGDWILVHAAAGGVGSILCEMCSSIGAKVIGTAGTPEKMETAKKNGAEWVISSRKAQDELVAEVMKITEGHGIDCVFDGVGAATFEADMQLAARKATLCVFGNASGAVPPVDPLRLSAGTPAKNLKLMRPTLFGYVVTAEEFHKYATELIGMIEKGVVKLEKTSTYQLENAKQAHLDLESRKTTGKLLLQVPQ
ncbi:quinone oxidoreductase [Apiospora rasikravindrae]|uniref:Quinone oxidoreductase n=1 Tax=Apiospora rasikravindrae TaxID=990691 RepID=A0ABR1UC31_9PEZI